VVPLLEAALGAVEPGDPPDAPAVADAQADTLLVAEADESDAPPGTMGEGDATPAPETADAPAIDGTSQADSDDGDDSQADSKRSVDRAPPGNSPAPGEADSAADEPPATAGTNRDEESDDGGSQPDAAATTTISALEYNKVMRLLQNREFPVERAELETVATSAYDLARPEVAEVIDLAIDRDLLVEADGELSRPD
jgi:hypothetical protein